MLLKYLFGFNEIPEVSAPLLLKPADKTFQLSPKATG